MATVPTVSRKESWWRRWLVAPVRAQLSQGISVDRVSWTIALGLVLGVFPVMGTTSLVCLLVGWAFHLNQPLLHLFKTVVYPLHLALILVFIRLGERLYGVPLISFSIPELLGKFKAAPLQFVQDFGMAAWHGVTAWLLIAPFAVILIKSLMMPILRRMGKALEKSKGVIA